jgi:small subunit ribosomal protein S16
MATVIRFARHGTKKKPFYKIVVQDQRSPRDGRFIEKIGSFDPGAKGTLNLSRERMEYWISTGAQMSDSVKKRVRVQLREWAGVATTGAAATTTAAAPKAPAGKKSAAPKEA